MATFQDKLVVLRLYSNYILSGCCITHYAACNHVGPGLQMSWKKVNEIMKKFDGCDGDVYQLAVISKTTRGTANEQYSFEHVGIRGGILLFCHKYCLKNLTDNGAISSYAELHRVLEEEFDVGVSTEALRRRPIKVFNYAFFHIPYDTASVKNTFQTHHFLLLYSEALQSQLRGEIKVAYMDETWVWKYHSTKKGIAPVGTARRSIKSGKGDRLIVVDAITNDNLRCAGAEMIASFHDDFASESSSLGSNESLRKDDGIDEDIVTALWTWVYQQKGDYHNAMDHEKFQDWVNNHFMPTWKGDALNFPAVSSWIMHHIT